MYVIDFTTEVFQKTLLCLTEIINYTKRWTGHTWCEWDARQST